MPPKVRRETTKKDAISIKALSLKEQVEYISKNVNNLKNEVRQSLISFIISINISNKAIKQVYNDILLDINELSADQIHSIYTYISNNLELL